LMSYNIIFFNKNLLIKIIYGVTVNIFYLKHKVI
jgi:hypothetical protein